MYGANDDGTFGEPEQYQVELGRVVAAVPGDVDADGRLDVLTASSCGKVTSMLQDETGALGFSNAISTGARPTSVAIADFDRDGNLDVASANYTDPEGSVSVLSGRGDGTFRSHRDIVIPSGSRLVRVADLNGDRRPDLVTLNVTPGPGPVSISVLLGRGRGGFDAARTVLDELRGVTDLRVADLNLDGWPDLVIANSLSAGPFANSVAVFLGNGDGSFGTRTSLVLGRGVGNVPLNLALGDLNHDRKPDLVVANNGAPARVYLGSGDGSFQAPTDSVQGVGAPGGMAIADVNHDRQNDLVGAYWVALGNGDGTFEAQVLLEMGSCSYGVANLWDEMAVADLDRDGWADVLATDGKSIVVFRGSGNGAFHAAEFYAGGDAPRAIAVADLNDDGYSDAVVANYGTNSITVQLNRGRGGRHRDRGKGDSDGVEEQVVEAQAPTGPIAVLRALNGPRGPIGFDYTLPRDGAVELRLYDVAGRSVATLVREALAAGNHHVHWDGGELRRGVYFAMLRIDRQPLIRTTVVLR